MLAIYAADPTLPPLDADMSTADLYRSILKEFGRREARKAVGDYVHGRELDEKGPGSPSTARDRRTRHVLNPPRTSSIEQELGTDLKALDEQLHGHGQSPPGAGQRVIGEFFFVHAPEARMTVHDGKSRREYEFLHATFVECLVARRVIDKLCEVGEGVRQGGADPLTHRTTCFLHCFSTSHWPPGTPPSPSPNRSPAALPGAQRTQLLDTLEMLLEMYRDRHGSGCPLCEAPPPRTD